MKVQDVKKECLATIGLSIELSNAEINSLSSLLKDVTDAINNTVETTRATVCTTRERYKEHEKIDATTTLKTLKRIEWLLVQLTRRDMSGLFDFADAEYRADVNYINDIPAKNEQVPEIPSQI
jgi:hypothetical protein